MWRGRQSSPGDGNCLLHAASLAMWGVHDRELRLRRSLKREMEGAHGKAFQTRWRQTRSHILGEAGLVDGWLSLKRQTTVTPQAGKQGKIEFKYLEQLHIFALAHLLRRPIIVYDDRYLRDVHGKVSAP